jgi:hypothetical protein
MHHSVSEDKTAWTAHCAIIMSRRRLGWLASKRSVQNGDTIYREYFTVCFCRRCSQSCTKAVPTSLTHSRGPRRDDGDDTETDEQCVVVC